MKRWTALLLLCLSPSAFAQGDVTVLRGTPAPPPPPAPPQVIVVQPPAVAYPPTYYYPQPYYGVPPVQPPPRQRSYDGWPTFRR